MKVLLLSSGESIHTCRWANSLVNKGIDVVLVTRHEFLEEIDNKVVKYKLSHGGKIGYFLNISNLKNILGIEKPDIFHVHFASGYGTLAMLTKKKYILSVWGSDVYDFPKENPIFKGILKLVLKCSKKIYSTSHCMKIETNKYTKKDIQVIPFGVDINKYLEPNRKEGLIVIGCVKILADKYGIDVLINAFSIVKSKITQPIKLVIGGDGPKRSELEALCHDYDISKDTEFLGWIKNDNVPNILSTFDICVLPSRLDSESFGVAAVEAGAAKLPCIVSNVGGLPEVIVDKVTGIVVDKNNPDQLADAIIDLINDEEKRLSIGLSAYERVSSTYIWDENVNSMVDQYKLYIKEEVA